MKNTTELTSNEIRADFSRLSEIIPFIKRVEKISIHSKPMWDNEYYVSFCYNDSLHSKSCCFDDMRYFIAQWKGFSVEGISFVMKFKI
jgi:hypothetical protein